MFDDPGTCYIEGIVSTNLQLLVEDESENECVQQYKEIEKCAYDSNEENEEGFELGERTLPLCFASFELLKQNVYNVSNQKSSRSDVEYRRKQWTCEWKPSSIMFFFLWIVESKSWDNKGS